jgi:hypothetical protein
MFLIQKLLPKMLKSEEAIICAVNEVGNLATGEAIEQFDTDGSAIIKDDKAWTSFEANVFCFLNSKNKKHLPRKESKLKHIRHLMVK